MSVVFGSNTPVAGIDVSIDLPRRDIASAMLRGVAGHCPNCGKGAVFRGYTAVNDACPACGEVLSHHRADDFPPYITMFITGHVVIASMLLVERAYHPELWVHMALWLPLVLLLSFGLLRPVKGAIIGLQWALYMHGFDPRKGEDQPEPDPAGELRDQG